MKGAGRVQVRAGAATDTGRVRSQNQDNYMLLPERGLWVVADGMGGAQGGEVASKLAIDTLRESYVDPGADELAAAVREANRRIHEAARSPELRGMGTTTVAIALMADDIDVDPAGAPQQHLVIINVGDSRAYLFRDGGLTQITDDHSVVAELVRDGHLTAQEADAHPQRNIITRVLGVYPQVEADLWPIDPVRGDRFLLCSDGLFNEVSTDQMAAVLRRLEDPSDAAAELVRLALEGGGRDNVTVLVLDVIDDGGQAARASRALGADPAGFRSALSSDRRLSDAQLDGARSAPGATRRQRRAARKAAKSSRTRLTWRVLLFSLLLAGVIGGAVATIQWYGTSTYYVGFDGDQVAIFRGRPGGLLWIEPTLEDDTGILQSEVPERYLAALEAGHEQASLAQARRYVSNIERDIAAATASATTTTTVPPPPAPAPSTTP